MLTNYTLVDFELIRTFYNWVIELRVILSRKQKRGKAAMRVLEVPIKYFI